MGWVCHGALSLPHSTPGTFPSSTPQRQPSGALTCPALLSRSLLVRLHEALKQCQDLKTEKGQMDRKINQLSEENGDLSFKVRRSAVPRFVPLHPSDQGQHRP